MGERTYIVTTFIKKLKKGEKEWVLSPQGFKRVSDDKTVDISKLPEDDKGLYYKDEPYTTKKLQQRFFFFYKLSKTGFFYLPPSFTYLQNISNIIIKKIGTYCVKPIIQSFFSNFVFI